MATPNESVAATRSDSAATVGPARITEDADGAGVIEDDARDGIIGQFTNETSAQTKPGAGVGDVEFAAADIHFESAGKFDAAMSGRGESHHTFAEAKDVEFAFRCVAQGQCHI